jgi:hypothetical protein
MFWITFDIYPGAEPDRDQSAGRGASEAIGHRQQLTAGLGVEVADQGGADIATNSAAIAGDELECHWDPPIGFVGMPQVTSVCGAHEEIANEGRGLSSKQDQTLEDWGHHLAPSAA